MYRATVCGSFRRHLKEVQAAMDELKQNGVQILSPGGTVALGEGGGFTFLASDPSLDILETEHSHVRAISKSHFIWLVCPDGEIGTSASFEIGCAIAREKLIFCTNEVRQDPFGLLDVRKFVTVVPGLWFALRLVEGRLEKERMVAAVTPALELPFEFGLGYGLLDPPETVPAERGFFIRYRW
jgi:hypothetical protein